MDYFPKSVSTFEPLTHSAFLSLPSSISSINIIRFLVTYNNNQFQHEGKKKSKRTDENDRNET